MKPRSKSQWLKVLLVSGVSCLLFLKVPTHLSGTLVSFFILTFKIFSGFVTGRLLITIYNTLKYLSCIKIVYNNNLRCSWITSAKIVTICYLFILTSYSELVFRNLIQFWISNSVLPVAHDYDVICLLETFLDSSISNKDEKINIKGYNLLQVDHQSNKKREGFVYITRNTFLILEKVIDVPFFFFFGSFVMT